MDRITVDMVVNSIGRLRTHTDEKQAEAV
jgi:hypothetical protein